MNEYEVRVTAKHGDPLEDLLDAQPWNGWGAVLIEDAPPYVVLLVDASSPVDALRQVCCDLPDGTPVVEVSVTFPAPE